MDTSTESDVSGRSRSPALPPPRLEDVRKNYTKTYNSQECMQFCIILDNYVQNIDSYHFRTQTEENQFSFHAHQFL
ncbi:hypothetical protein TNIN_341271 [Trichonephila inaurata madagascariensis]|uniref:Uncharacterized protein n=1 Tax=Trichonephila inaurata madagascariensis TaxID=2747483 RepID=A0A8X6XN74_9ARAC|nr:hypothetical protein TNIN_341271 [Trichonephila inaurata madagascariensis]